MCTWVRRDFRLKVQASINNAGMCMCTWVRNDLRLKVQADVNSKTMLAYEYMGDKLGKLI